MKRNILLLILLTNAIFAFSQQLNFEINNNTGRRIKLFQINYETDSMYYIGHSYNGSIDGLIAAKGKASIGYINYSPLRIDFIAVDDSTQDTLFSKSFAGNELKNEKIQVEVNFGEISRLPNNIKPSPCLQIKGKHHHVVLLKKRDKVIIKTTNRKRIEGTVKSFNLEYIYIVDKNGIEIVLPTNEFRGLRICGHFLNIGIFSFFPFCLFNICKDPKFKILHYYCRDNSNNGWK